MANVIIHQEVKNANPSWEDLIRHERTAGGLAVMDGVRQNTGGGVGPSPLPVPSPINAQPITKLTTTRIVGFAKLKRLLHPLHQWFQNKIGFIQLFRLYEDKDNRTLAYPKVKVLDRDNPYRRYQLNAKSSARTYKRVKQFVEDRKLDDFMMASLILTMPKFMSEFLADKGVRGRDMAWRLYEGFWCEDMPVIIRQNIGLGCHVNLHLWRTGKPIEPHYHFHCLIPNYGLSESNIKDETGELAWEFKFKRWEWCRQRGGKIVPFSDMQLEGIKKCWHDRLMRFCRRHGLEWREQSINVWCEYIDKWQKLHHCFNYNGRHWTENYAEYSNENLDCPEPPEWLKHYDNRARVKGWWSNLKNITTESDEKEKISPYTGENMKYRDTSDGTTLENLIKYAGGSLGYVEFIKGYPFEGDLNEEEIEWLKGVMVFKEDSFDVESLYLDTT